MKCPHCERDLPVSEKGDILEIIRHNESVDDNGDPVGAKPETSWEVGYAAGIRCLYRFLKGIPNAAPQVSELRPVPKGSPQPAVAAPELRAGSAALKTCATSAADESSPHGTAHQDNQSLPQATDEWKGPYVQPNSSGSISSDKNYLLTVERIDEFRREQHIPPQPGDQDWIAEENAALDAICAAAKAHLSARGHIVIPEELRRLAELANELCVSLDSEAEDIGGVRSSGEILKEFGPATDAAFEVLDRTGNRSPR